MRRPVGGGGGGGGLTNKRTAERRRRRRAAGGERANTRPFACAAGACHLAEARGAAWPLLASGASRASRRRSRAETPCDLRASCAAPSGRPIGADNWGHPFASRCRRRRRVAPDSSDTIGHFETRRTCTESAGRLSCATAGACRRGRPPSRAAPPSGRFKIGPTGAAARSGASELGAA